MKPYLRKHELVASLYIKKTTLTRWIRYFKEFIPIIQQGDIDCYGHDATAVLIRIKNLRKELYSLPHIREILMNEGYPIFENQ